MITKQQPNPPAVRFRESFSESSRHPTLTSAFPRGKRKAKKGGGAQCRWSLVGFGAKLRPLARHSLEASLDAGDGAAGVARFTLKEIKASVLLQDGLWGAASVTRNVFLCRDEKTVTTAANTGGHCVILCLSCSW